jgi:hypothetical protein
MSDGTFIRVPESGVVVFVGPNNAGKSVSLRDIKEHLGRQGDLPTAVTSLDVNKQGDDEDLVDWLDQNFHKTFRQGDDQYSRGEDGEFPKRGLTQQWSSGPPFQILGEMFVYFAAGDTRLQSANGVQNIDFETQAPTHPLHHLYDKPELEKKVSDVSVRAFRNPLILDRVSGNMLYLRVGEAPPAPPCTGPAPHEYRTAVRELPLLPEQGDGMRSFVGLLLNILTSSYPFILVDEPEAFLHPPQAKLLGRMLADEKPEDTQVLIATHNSDVLKGLLDSSVKDITVVRLVREEKINHTSQLDPEKIKSLWNDPLLRYSDILDGLFHEAVILCEGDADCRFYASVLDALDEDEDERERPDLLFTHCGGKDRMPMVVGSLRAVSVPVRVIADFDILREKEPLQRIFTMLGGDWPSIEDDWRIVKNSLDNNTKAPSTAWVREELQKLLDNIATQNLTQKDTETIRQLTKSDSGWDQTKRSGTSAVPSGDAAQRISRLLDKLREYGLFVVEVGELERFVPEVGGHGPSWVSTVHEEGWHAAESLTAARSFVREVVESLQQSKLTS